MNKSYLYLFSFMFILFGLAIGISLGLKIGGLISTFTLVSTCLFSIGGIIATFRDWFKAIK